MNVVGLLIGIVFWFVVLWLFPDLPPYVRLPIRFFTIVLIYLFIVRTYRWWKGKKTEVDT